MHARVFSLPTPTPRSLARLVVLFALAVAAPARAGGVAVSDATARQNDAAERKIADGKKLLAKGKLEEALAKFREAHEIVATPRATLMIARAHRDTGELVTAHAEYTKALPEARAAAAANPKYEETLSTVRTELDELEGVLGKLVVKLIHAPAGTEVTVDGQPVDAAKLSSPMLVAPGDLAVVATAPDGQVAHRRASITAGQSATVELAFARDSEPATFFASEASESKDDAKPAKKDEGGGINPLVYVAGGVGVVGIATFAVAGSMANSKFDELEKACPNGQCPPERQGDIDDGKQLQTIANVGLAVGVAGLATGAGLLVFGGSKGDEPKKRPTAKLAVGFLSVHLKGSFW